MATPDISLSPFLAWAGGKRWFVQRHAEFFPKTFNRYIEPFLGGGSVFFYLQPRKALLGDINSDLIAAYQGIKNNWQSIYRSLQHHSRQHSDEHYYYARDLRPRNEVQRASRMIYLNRTCFNGIFRVNLQGEFNVPRGTKNTVILETDCFEEMSTLLKHADIKVADFEELINKAKKDDFIFADPPYTVRHNLNGFVKYNEKLFSWDDQERLAEALLRAKNRGAKILCTNACHSTVKSLYEERGFDLTQTSRFSSISADPSHRKQFEELIISFNLQG